MENKIRLPKLIKTNGITIKRVYKKDTNLLEELLLLYSKNENHLYFWHRNILVLKFKNINEYLQYLSNGKSFCYVIIVSGKIIGCIEIGQLSIDYNYLKNRSLTYWIDESNTRKGIMFNVLSVLEDIFRSQNLDYFEAQVLSDNIPSIKLLEKLQYTIKTKFSTMNPETGEIVQTVIFYKKNLNNYSQSEIQEKKREINKRKCLCFIEKCKKHKCRKIDLSNLNLIEIPKELLKMTWIKKLDLSYNEITQLPEWIDTFSELIELKLNSNKLTSLPYSLHKLKNLKHLDISSNKINELPDSYIELKRWKHWILQVIILKNCLAGYWNYKI